MMVGVRTPASTIAGLGDDAGAPLNWASWLQWLAIGVGVALIVPAIWRAVK